MSDTTPNSLEPTKKVDAARMSKWPLYAVLLVGLFLLGILVYSVNFAHNQEEEQAGTPKVDIKEEEKPLLMGEGRGLALAPPAGSPALAVPDAPVQSGTTREPLIVVQSDKSQSDNYRQELENLRRMKAQAQLTALSAPLGVQKSSQTNTAPASYAGSGSSTDRPSMSLPADAYGLQANDYSPAADKDKEAFFDRAGKDANWILPHSRTAGQRYEVKTGAVIPGIMVTGINSDLPGNIIAQVSQNVFDTATGNHLLLPQGAKLFGVYDSRVIYGQERVLVAWNRVVFPDGSAVTLGAMPGSDMSGYAGYTDKVNNHYLRIFGSAILMSMISGGMAYTMDSLDSGGDSDNPTLQNEMGSALAAQLGQATLQLLQKNLNIKPTLEIRPGYQFNVIVTKDLVFERPYRPQR